MTVKMDEEAKALTKLLDGYEKFNDKFVDKLAKSMVANQDKSPIQNRFQRSAQNNRTYEPLKPKTKAQKEKKGEPYAMQSSGDTKRAVKKSIRGIAKKDKIIFTADVPKYAAMHNDGTGNAPQRQFFSFNGKSGRPLAPDVNNFNSVADNVFNALLAKEGLKIRR